MEYVKLLKDYTKTTLEQGLNDFLSEKLTSIICREKIKNVDYMLLNLKPAHEFIISTTAYPNGNMIRY